MALRQKPDRLVVPRRARVLTGSITSRQIFDAQVVFDIGHGSPPRFMAAYANRFDPKRESAMPESFARKPYQSFELAPAVGNVAADNENAILYTVAFKLLQACRRSPAGHHFFPSSLESRSSISTSSTVRVKLSTTLDSSAASAGVSS